MSNQRLPVLSPCSLVAAVLFFSAGFSQATDKQLLNRLGGVYGGNYAITNAFFNEDGEEVDSGQFSTGGRVVLPRRNGQRLRGSVSLGLGFADFSQPVRRIRIRGNSAVYRGPFILTVRESDQDPFVGRFRARSKIKRTKEQLIFRFTSSVERESIGPDSPAISLLSARFKSIR